MEGDKKPFDHIIHAFPVKESLGCNSTRGQALWRVPILSLHEKRISECSVVVIVEVYLVWFDLDITVSRMAACKEAQPVIVLKLSIEGPGLTDSVCLLPY